MIDCLPKLTLWPAVPIYIIARTLIQFSACFEGVCFCEGKLTAWWPWSLEPNIWWMTNASGHYPLSLTLFVKNGFLLKPQTTNQKQSRFMYNSQLVCLTRLWADSHLTCQNVLHEQKVAVYYSICQNLLKKKRQLTHFDIWFLQASPSVYSILIYIWIVMIIYKDLFI